jgi:hypothetical protein
MLMKKLIQVSCTIAAVMVTNGSRLSAVGQGVPLHVLKIAAGPSGAESNGTFVLNEERSVYNRADDREIIVLFQWEGMSGQHTLVARWRSPDGGANSESTINYTAKERRFGAYWRLPISPAMPTGTWTVEATVDGQPGGRLNFEVTDTKVQPVIVKRPFSQSALYERLSGIFVTIERFSAAGRKLDGFSGLLSSNGRIYTTLGAVDDSDRLRAILPDGSGHDLQNIIAWDRRQDWAVLETSAEKNTPFAVASPESIKIGDRCFSMEGSPTGGRVLSELSISGQRAAGATGGAGWLATFVSEFGTPGAPVVNEFGEVVGIIGTSAPGATRLALSMRFRAEMKGAPIVPITAFRVRPDTSGTAILDLRRRGDLIPVLAGEQHVLSGGFARSITRTNTVAPADQSEEFSAQEKKIVAFVSWNPPRNSRGRRRSDSLTWTIERY